MRRIFLSASIACPFLLSLIGWQRSSVISLPAPAAAATQAPRGSISGQVIWEGGLPVAPQFAVRTHDHFTRAHLVGKQFDNPNLPVVDAKSQGVAGAVIYLGDLDSDHCIAWPHAPVRVEQRDLQFLIHQGQQGARSGFVRQGDTVEFVSRENRLHVLRARGAAFFALPFIEPARPTVRRLPETGLVELTSGIGYYWMHGYLFVCDNPYITRTDSQGRFQLHNVPAGNCSIVCWMPNWRVLKHERETEAGYINHTDFARPMEQERRITVEHGQDTPMNFTVYQLLFEQ